MKYKKKRIAYLPVAGHENPYQHLMLEGLKKELPEIEFVPGKDQKFFPFLATTLAHKPDYIHLDWIGRYYIRRGLITTYISYILFCLDLFVASRIMGVGFLWTLHNIEEHDLDRKKRSLDRKAKNFLSRHCRWVRVFAQSTADRLRKIVPKQTDIKVLPEGSYIGYYENTMSRKVARKALKITPETFLLVYIGSIRPYKGLDELIKFFQKTKRQNWNLLMAGKPTNKAYVDKLKSSIGRDSDIMLELTFIEPEELQKYLNAADLYVAPFRQVENSGSIIMAMGFGLPVLAPHMGALPERLNNQHMLLYKERMEEVFAHLDEYSRETLHAIGKKNTEQVLAHKWEDYARLFRSL